jgi:hypothetical protein
MYNKIVSEALIQATLTIKGKSYIMTVVNDIEQMVSSKYVANGSQVKVPVAGLAEFKNVTASCPYDEVLGPELEALATSVKGTKGHTLRLSNSAEDTNPRTVSVMVLGVKSPGSNADGNGEAKLTIELAPYSLSYAKAANSTKNKDTRRAQGEAEGDGTVNSVASALAETLTPNSTASLNIGGIPITFSI